jgi:DNA modification methylase
MIIEKKVKELVFAEYNPRQVSKNAIDRLKKSLSSPQGKELFKRRPILVNQREGKLVVYAGNMRLRAAMALGMTEVPCIVDEITLAEEKERNIKDNLVIGEWDDDLLANNFDLEELEDWGVDLKELGIEPIGDEETDEVPEPPKEARAKFGEVYTLGRHRLMCGDSMMIDDVEKLMDGQKADMVFTDPPYNTGMTEKRDSTWLNHMFNDSYTPEQWSKFLLDVFTNYYAFTKGDAAFYVCIDWRRVGDVRTAMEKLLHVSNVIVWDKVVHGLGSDYKYTYELVVVGKKGKPEIRSHHNDEYRDIWHIQRKVGKNEDHATAKPLELCSRPIRHASKQDDIVLDLFLGSGSTLIASEQLKRSCYGMEIDPRYVDVIIERYCNYVKCDKEEIYDSSVQVVQENVEVEKG